MTSNGVRVLQVGADRSKRGIMVPGSAAYARQRAYAEKFGQLDIINFSVQHDGFEERHDGPLHIHPTNSVNKFLYGLNALFISTRLPWPDVISAQDPFEAGLTALVISRFVGKPLHVQVHTDFLSPEYAKHSLMNRLRVHMARLSLRRAARVRVVSQRIKDSIQAAYDLHVPITVLPIFVDVERVRAASPDAALVHRFERFSHRLLFVGRLEPEKHPCLALRAFAKAPSDACLIVVGTGSENAYLTQLAKELGVSDRVFFEGEKESAPYYALADLVLVTSRYEGYGLVIIEALSRGVPVISTDVGIAREAGAIVAPEDRYADALGEWFAGGPREATLSGYPYANFDGYVAAYCADIEACIKPA